MITDNPPINPPENGRRGLITFAALEERLVEALRLWERAPDRERGWLHVRAYWPEIVRQGWRVGVDGEHDEREEEDPRARRLPLTRAEVAEMTEASELLKLVPERDRKLVALVLDYLAKASDEAASRIPWLRLWQRLGRGAPGPDGLRKRYSRAITTVCNALNG